MQLSVNGVTHTVEAALSIDQLVRQLGLAERRLAVEVNRQIVPRSLHAAHVLAEGDAVELVAAIGGG